MRIFDTSRFAPAFAIVALAATAHGCGNSVANEESARRAYFGIDRAVDRALQLGFQGFNAASSANIDPQTANGDVAGTITVTGQVDQGASDNKGMRLSVALVDYEDRVVLGDGGEEESDIVYDTPTPAPALTLSLRNIPNGTLTGTLVGTFRMSGDLEGDVTLNLMFAGNIEAADGMTQVRRVPGSTVITGTATSSYGTYNVNITR